MPQLSEDDGQAVDRFVEDRRGGAGDERLESVGRIFWLIQQMPADEPAWNLVARTMRRVNRVALEEDSAAGVNHLNV